MTEWSKKHCFCLECKHTWTGIVPDNKYSELECPSCHKMEGIVFKSI